LRLSIAKIGLLLVIVIVLPTIFFSAYEVSNLQRNEQMIDSIYVRQLESVLFSINQYSDDVVSSWASDIDAILKSNNIYKKERFHEFMNGHQSVNWIFLSDSINQAEIYSKVGDDEQKQIQDTMVNNLLRDNKMSITKLYQYIKSGYRKIQPVDIKADGKSLFLFLVTKSENLHQLCGIIVNTESFIRENLGPKIQSVAQNTFYISVFDKKNNNEIYSNELTVNPQRNIEHKKSIWLFPDYELGIKLKGETISDLANRRTNFNLWTIVILDIILLLAAWFVYRAVRQEIKLAQLKSEFVANVSHEIRTPLAIINMYSETLQMDRLKSEDKKHEYYKVINTETNRLSGIVNKILNFSKIESGKRAYKFEISDLNGIVKQVVETYQHHFKTKEFSCKTYFYQDKLTIKADREAVTDAIINLIDNAIKYSSDKKQIDIKTGLEKDNIYAEVKDYGIGIENKDQKLVFEKFYRVTSGNLAYKAQGSGIGLSIVKHIMEAHGGSVALESIPGKGSTFRLNFPKMST